MKPLFDNSVAIAPTAQAEQHAEPLETWGRRIVRENFLVLLLTMLFLIIVGLWYFTPDAERAKDLKELANGVFYALLALLGVRPLARQVVPPAAIQVDNVERMQSGGPTSIGNAGNGDTSGSNAGSDDARSDNAAGGDTPKETNERKQEQVKREYQRQKDAWETELKTNEGGTNEKNNQ